MSLTFCAILKNVKVFYFVLVNAFTSNLWLYSYLLVEMCETILRYVNTTCMHVYTQGGIIIISSYFYAIIL